MHIIISNSGDCPIYEQITKQIKEMILSEEITGGEMLPSIRSLARDLRISVITTKRAYEELERDGFIETIPSKGCFVKCKNNNLLKEEILKKIENHLQEAIQIGNKYHIDKDQIEEMFTYLYEEDKNGK